jgi:signal transduction histidine kinase
VGELYAKEKRKSISSLIEQLEAEQERSAHARVALATRLSSIEDERRRIARDLHDNIGQRLTGLRLKLEGAAIAAAGSDVQRQIAEAQAAAEQIDAALDFVAAELRPATLDLGLVTALEQFVRHWSATFGVGAQLHADGLVNRRPKPEVETQVYRVAQEALNNVYKHAKAKNATVVLECRRDHLVLIVEDDGQGFQIDCDLVERRRHFGLVSMRERAQLLGGEIEIESAPRRGTTVFLQIPDAFPRAETP